MDLKTLLDTPPWEWPPEAAQKFNETLRNRRADASDRLAAAEMAGDLTVMNDDLAEALLAILSSPDEPAELRAQAAISFGPVLEQCWIDEFDDPDQFYITEDTFHDIQDLLQEINMDPDAPKELRRRALEASVRAPEDWHEQAIREAYASGDSEWMLTAVFAMRWIAGFNAQILESLKSADPQIHKEAVIGAGARSLEEAWPCVLKLVKAPDTPKDLLLAAIEAVAAIRPKKAGATLARLAESEDEDIAEAAEEAIDLAEAMSGSDPGEDSRSWIN